MIGKVLILLAVICFVLAAFGVAASHLSLLALGLAFWASAGLVS